MSDIFPDNQKSYRYVPRYVGTNLQYWTNRVEQTVNGLVNGASNNLGEITLAASTAATTVNIALGRLSQDSVITFMATTANAATELASGSMYVSARNITKRYNETNTFTITHTNSAQTDRIFKFAMIG